MVTFAIVGCRGAETHEVFDVLEDLPSIRIELVESASDILAPLRAGESLFVFPEGTFVAEPGLLPFRLGAFRAAADSDCPVVPVSIRGMRDIFPAGTWLLRPGRVTVTIGKPIRSRNQDWSEMVRMRDEARAVIARETGED